MPNQENGNLKEELRGLHQGYSRLKDEVAQVRVNVTKLEGKVVSHEENCQLKYVREEMIKDSCQSRRWIVSLVGVMVVVGLSIAGAFGALVKDKADRAEVAALNTKVEDIVQEGHQAQLQSLRLLSEIKEKVAEIRVKVSKEGE